MPHEGSLSATVLARQAFGWKLLRAMRPYCLVVLAASATTHLVLNPSWATAAAGASGAAGTAVAIYRRRR
jgi:hypothetical protein